MNTDPFFVDRLKLWKDEGIDAPMNELQSIAAWLRTSSDCKTLEELKNLMRVRMVLLMEASNDLAEEGHAVAEEAGIYDLRPDMRPELTLEEQEIEAEKQHDNEIHQATWQATTEGKS